MNFLEIFELTISFKYLMNPCLTQMLFSKVSENLATIVKAISKWERVNPIHDYSVPY